MITVLDRLGSTDESVITLPLSSLAGHDVGPRTTLFVDPPPSGWYGLVTVNRRLRAECPWDREQTHHSLVSHLVEEAYETVDALSRLDPEAPSGTPNFGAYAEVEEELGDLLLQVVFHATLATEAGAFGVEEVAESVRRKLVRRHPHVFADVAAGTAQQVIANWEHLKTAEKGRESLMDDIPTVMPAISRADKMQRRAASVGFDWNAVEPVIAKVREELDRSRPGTWQPGTGCGRAWGSAVRRRQPGEAPQRSTRSWRSGMLRRSSPGVSAASNIWQPMKVGFSRSCRSARWISYGNG